MTVQAQKDDIDHLLNLIKIGAKVCVFNENEDDFSVWIIYSNPYFMSEIRKKPGLNEYKVLKEDEVRLALKYREKGKD
ncbi:MAG TPA: hypothetical protein VIJ14_10400 [Rhabdochlamydiaceae bacterium]